MLDASGRLLDVRADLGDDDAIIAWVRTHLGDRGVIGIDMPTIVNNASGMRVAERALNAVFRSRHAGAHPANTARFPGGPRARTIIDALQPDGVVEALDVRPGDSRTVALEVFPHPAHVRLFELDRIFKYKKKRQPWAVALAAWAEYRRQLGRLASADPPLVLDPAIVPHVVGSERYKRWDDALDAITCAYVASYVWRWGMNPEWVEVFGDLAGGYIVVPARGAVWKASEPGT